MAKKYIVRLSCEERETLQEVIKKSLYQVYSEVLIIRGLSIQLELPDETPILWRGYSVF